MTLDLSKKAGTNVIPASVPESDLVTKRRIGSKTQLTHNKNKAWQRTFPHTQPLSRTDSAINAE